MKKFQSIVIILLATLMATSCVSRKKLIYFQGADSLYAKAQKIAQQYEMRLKPADQVLVKITCPDKDLLNIFAQDVTMGSNTQTTSSYSSGTLSNSYGFTVTNDGHLILPAVGKVFVDNMTTEECARAIEAKVKELNLIKDPEVTVRLLNARVTVVGAVQGPRVVNLTSERNSVIDVLAQCGDLNEMSLRKKIKLFRENNGERTMYEMDITDVNIFTNPAFYVQQNDLIYIEPNKSLGVKSSSFYTFLGAGASILGLISSIVALVIAIKKN
jgi:polysaccharide export outer membrane protein